MANSIECKSCGNIFHTEQIKCPYCGTPNINASNQKSNTDGQNPRPNNFNTYNNAPRYNYTPSKDSNINVCLLIFLVVIFWPAAIVYVIIKMNNKNQ